MQLVTGSTGKYLDVRSRTNEWSETHQHLAPHAHHLVAGSRKRGDSAPVLITSDVPMPDIASVPTRVQPAIGGNLVPYAAS